MSDLGDAAARVGEKITELLDVFDLSFFMSGSLSMSAILLMLPESIPNPVRGDAVSGAVIFGLVLGSYVLGLLCFALGRPLRGVLGLPMWRVIRRALRRQPTESTTESGFVEHEVVLGALRAQCVTPAELERYFSFPPSAAKDPRAVMALYTRMWVHVRSYSSMSASFALLKRYWMLSAAYDGIAIAALVWLLPVWVVFGDTSRIHAHPALLTGLILLATLSCWHRAQAYKRYQIEEIAATVAHWFNLLGKKEFEGGSASAMAEGGSMPDAQQAASSEPLG
ncbi:hypothetical protein [Paraliomyxa miuraensis]|uniref:hypothetical protein n=1 Tax=Paraliomyxa miuraensis TaxID=376150 RepID=UPI00225B2978|nr:hypothetical protein [Paraliomyxa miuraensis]MCX4245120.1 hypothetical protein [Paraliomyxa miuraensis]